MCCYSSKQYVVNEENTHQSYLTDPKNNEQLILILNRIFTNKKMIGKAFSLLCTKIFYKHHTPKDNLCVYYSNVQIVNRVFAGNILFKFLIC